MTGRVQEHVMTTDLVINGLSRPSKWTWYTSVKPKSVLLPQLPSSSLLLLLLLSLNCGCTLDTVPLITLRTLTGSLLISFFLQNSCMRLTEGAGAKPGAVGTRCSVTSSASHFDFCRAKSIKAPGDWPGCRVRGVRK